MAKLSTRLAPRLRPLVLSRRLPTTTRWLKLPSDLTSLGESRSLVSSVRWLSCRCRIGLPTIREYRCSYLTLGPRLVCGVRMAERLMVRTTVELVSLGRSVQRQQNEPWPIRVLCMILAMATPWHLRLVSSL